MISIIVPIKNQYKIVMMCLTSLKRYYKNEDIVIVDDGSTEENTIKFLKEFCQKNDWILKRNEISLEHTKACEIGIENSKCDNIFLLNSDVILSEKCLYILSEVLDSHKNIAVVGPSTTSASGEQLIKELYNKRFSMTLNDIENYAKKIEKEKEIVDINLVNGFCFGIKRDIFEEVGKFDKNLESYGNEKELLIRIRNFGFRTVWVKNSYVHHFGKMSYSHENQNIGKKQAEADKLIIKKHGRLF